MDSMTSGDLGNYISTTLAQLKREKEPFMKDILEACAYMRHRVKDRNTPVNQIDIYNSTPMDAVNTCVNGIAGYLLSPSIMWFKYIVKGRNFEKSDKLYGANDWLEDVTQIQYSLYSNSRFYPVAHEALRDSIITGTSYEMITDRIAKKKKIVFECYSPFECYIAEDADGIVDTFYREYTMTARQAYERFGESLPDEVKDLVTKLEQPNKEVTFVHAIFPRDEHVKGMVSAKNKKFASVHYCRTGEKVVLESGYDEFPVAVHRWRKSGNSAYGIGLVVDFLPEIKKLNDLQKQFSIGVQFQASPVMQAPEALRNRFIYRPGAVNYAPANTGKPEVVPNQLNIQYLGQEIANLEQKLQRLLMADLFNVLMRQERQRTAYEVQELKGEGLILLSAIIGNMQDEKLTPDVIRTFRILLRSGLLPPPPAELIEASANGQITVELDGPLAQTMKAYHQATGLEQGLAALAAGVQLFPNAITNFDGDEIMRQYATAKGLPQSCIREISDVKKIQAEQARQQQQAEQQQQMLQQSQVLKNLGYDASAAAAVGQNQEQQGAMPGLLGGVA